MRLLKCEIVKHRLLRLGIVVHGRDVCTYLPGFRRTGVIGGQGDQPLVEASTVRGLGEV